MEALALVQQHAWDVTDVHYQEVITWKPHWQAMAGVGCGLAGVGCGLAGVGCGLAGVGCGLGAS